MVLYVNHALWDALLAIQTTSICAKVVCRTIILMGRIVLRFVLIFNNSPIKWIGLVKINVPAIPYHSFNLQFWLVILIARLKTLPIIETVFLIVLHKHLNNRYHKHVSIVHQNALCVLAHKTISVQNAWQVIIWMDLIAL